jgi:deazaflavin-dependent oxidoreductase (nitroreductase family)
MRKLDRFRYVMGGELATTRLFYTLHRAIYRLSGGRIFRRMVGCPVVLLTTTGRKSGEPRTAPLLGFEEGQSIVVIPSNAGKKHYPAWYLNLRANPRAQVQVGAQIRQVKAREATVEERDRLWPRIVTYYGGYQVYRERTQRHIPVIILEPV